MVDDARSERDAAHAASDSAATWSALPVFGLAAGLTALCLLLYGPALDGPYVSDDHGYLTSPYTASIDVESLMRAFDPFGDARLYTGNYAPVHLLGHAIERQVFAEELAGYHIVNVLVHALNAVLLVWLLLRSGLHPVAAWLAGLLFAVHPANVEAVAWISQLKTNGALALSLAALLALQKHPLLATLCFALALLTKASAAFALPMAAAFTWVRARGETPRDARPRGTWLFVWLAVFALYALSQVQAFSHIGSADVPALDDPGVQLRTIAVVGAHYLLMAATSIGVSAFQEPEPARSWLDPRWLAALPLAGLLGWRLFVTLRDRREEAAWWVAAAASFVPVSQLFPFLIPVADRYLYFILPGLLGGLFLGLQQCLGGDTARERTVVRILMIVSIFAVIGFGARSHERAKLWRNETLLLVDAARHYPDGGTAHYLRARRHAQEGTVAAAVASLRRASELGVDRYDSIRRDPAFGPLRSDASFQALVFELAGVSIERAPPLLESTQPELLARARAHLARAEDCSAAAALVRAADVDGPLADVVRRELDALRDSRALEACEGLSTEESGGQWSDGEGSDHRR